MQGKITKRTVDSLCASSGETTLWDSEVKGFGVRVRSGGAKTYIVRYRPGAGGRGAPLRTLTIGRHGSPWTPDTARGEAKRLLGLVEDGADPAADMIAQRVAPTVAELCDRFLSEHCATKLKARTAFEYRRLAERFIVPALGKRKVADVTRQEVARLHYSLHSTPYQANRALAFTSKMFNLAEAWGIRRDGSNPCRHIVKYREHLRERMLSADELGRLGSALAIYEGSPYVVVAVKLLLFTGARLSEVLGLKWEWIDFEKGEARLPDSKTGAKTLHLPPPALATLAETPRIEGNPFVIVGGKPGTRLNDMEAPWRDIRAGAGLEDVRLHDLRHAFASVAVSSGMGLPIIGKILGHTQASTTARYAHLASDPVKAAAASVASKIASAMASGETHNASVVNLRR
ncbi:MAG: tyrosine-type recombinase/integrase [Rhizomicrobium sp.]